ncbi:phage tail assembly chaperone [uncultured Duncaniella sp.]|uniref:phage tail assembly chaperone n=1 Tax=uncultured Duncaniella sp. TaxID=2768039 RepID=UPI00345C79B3
MGWDWPLLYYTGTVILRMNPVAFWKTTPARLNSLTRVYTELNSPHKKPKVARTIEEAGIDI